ncbi:MAG: prepilin-type N-terminal cleavage/methylation domain-containing protein [Planctomycetaceae bacterium]
MHHFKPQTTPHRQGFTLLELLAVITIISILLALILPALSRVLGRGDEAAVQAEFTQLDQALTTFKSKFGEYPPSYLRIPRMGGTWDPTSRAAVKRIWPQFDFSTSPPPGSSPGDANYLWNGGLNNPASADIYLSGAECLVFFLGGVQSGSTAAPVLSGFSKNPLTPWTSSGNPDGPFMEFDIARLVDVDGDGPYEYLDAFPGQTTPIFYLSGAGGSLNKDNDNYLQTLPPTSASLVVGNDDYDVFPSSAAAQNMLGCYLQPDSDADFTNNVPYKKDTFQLISPGEDGLYGLGGVYSEADAATLLSGTRAMESDNITNFSGGKLN